jgi:AraC-like DNA-binding protein
MSTMAYRELPPPPELASLVRCLWIRRADGSPTLILPDGCVDVVVRGGRATVAGPDTGPVTVALEPGAVVVGARFHPGAAAAALGVPADALRDGRIALEDLWGARGREIGERAGADPLALAAALRAVIGDGRADPLVLAVVRHLALEPGMPLPRVARAVDLGERQLRRRFATAVGYGPKTFARVMRFHRALRLLQAGEPPAGAAVSAGYADQAHLTREARALAGRTPAALRG